jgi:hypothetical protein
MTTTEIKTKDETGLDAPVLFYCPHCWSGNVRLVHEHPVEGFVLGLRGTVWEREYSCGHKDRAMEHSYRMRQQILAARRLIAKRSTKKAGY